MIDPANLFGPLPWDEFLRRLQVFSEEYCGGREPNLAMVAAMAYTLGAEAKMRLEPKEAE